MRKYTSIAGAVSAILWGGASYAQLASNEGDSLEEVVVTGLRHSIETSIETKKISDSIVESISAEDIGKLPDQSIAESLARLPGLAAQRVGGRAQVISLRGMAPDFAVTLLNGRELVSTGDNRGVEYDQYPSELISAVTVYKTPDAALGAQGLSGTVDLQTLRPLDLKERVFVVNGRYEHNGNGALNAGVSGNGNRFSTSYANKLADGKIGFAINYAHLDSPEQEKHFGAWGYGSNQIPFEQAVGLLGSEVIATSSKEKRDAFMAVVDFQATDKLRSTVDLYYSKFDSKSTARGLLWESAGCAWSDPGTNDYCDGVTVTNPTITNVPQFGITMVTAGTFAGISAVEQSNYDTRTDKLSAIGWNNQLKLESWTLESDLSYSKVKRRGQTFEMYAGLGNYGDMVDNNFQFSAPPGTAQPTFKPGLDYADASLIKLADPGAWGQDGFMRQPQVDDRLATLRLSAIHKLSGWINAVETGMWYSDRAKRHADHDYQYMLKNAGAPVLVDQDLLLQPTSLAWAGIPGVLAYDIEAARGRYFDVPVVDATQPSVWKRNYTITEKVTALYGKLNINSKLGSVAVRGNLGVQVIHTNQHADGFFGTDRGTSLGDGTSYTNVLPNLNLTFDLDPVSKDLYVRFGAARTMARARMDDLKAGVDAAVATTAPHVWSGDAGNPRLHPWIADSLDLSIEKYFGKRSYVAAAVFSKKLKTYIYTQVVGHVNFTGYPNPGGTVCDFNCPYGNMSMPINGEGGKIDGTEFSVALDGGLLWRRLDGFGLTGSYSSTSSAIHPDGPDFPDRSIPGLSKGVGDLTVYFEKAGFSARVSRRYRSPFRAETLGPHGDRIATEIRSEGIVDFQTSYEFEHGRAKGLSMLLQLDNLGNTPYRTRLVGGFGVSLDAPETYNTYGREVLFGVNYKL